MSVPQMDDLIYTYDTSIKNGNRLLRVTDSKSTAGFKNGSNTDDDYAYDANGNMITDKNKGITAIGYNQLNLPVKIEFGTNKIEYLYNATGQKVQKKVTISGTPNITDYLGSYQYKTLATGVATLEFFPHAEGYVKYDASVYSYVFNYTDHLGNVRLSYSDIDKDGTINKTTEVLEESNYYPFGLKHEGYTDPSKQPNYKYKYNGKEWQDELGLNMTSMDYRQYDPAIGRFVAMDRLSELTHSITPYRFGFNNPIQFIDPTGLSEEILNQRLTDYYHDPNGVVYFNPRVHGPNDVPKGMTYIGPTYTDPESGTFWDENGKPTYLLNEVTVTGKTKPKTLSDYYDDFTSDFNGFNDIFLGLGLTQLQDNYANNYEWVNRNYYKFYKKFKNTFKLPKPGKQRQFLKKLLSSSKFSKASKLIRKAGVVGTVLTVGSVVADGSDGSLKASSIIDGTLLAGGAIASAAFPPAAPFIAAGILIYGVSDYFLGINDRIDANTNEVKIMN